MLRFENFQAFLRQAKAMELALRQIQERPGDGLAVGHFHGSKGSFWASLGALGDTPPQPGVIERVLWFIARDINFGVATENLDGLRSAVASFEENLRFLPVDAGEHQPLETNACDRPQETANGANGAGAKKDKRGRTSGVVKIDRALEILHRRLKDGEPTDLLSITREAGIKDTRVLERSKRWNQISSEVLRIFREERGKQIQYPSRGAVQVDYVAVSAVSRDRMPDLDQSEPDTHYTDASEEPAHTPEQEPAYGTSRLADRVRKRRQTD